MTKYGFCLAALAATVFASQSFSEETKEKEDPCEATISKDLKELGLGTFYAPTATKNRMHDQARNTEIVNRYNAVRETMRDQSRQLRDYSRYGASMEIMTELGGHAKMTKTLSEPEFKKLSAEHEKLADEYRDLTDLMYITNLENRDGEVYFDRYPPQTAAANGVPAKVVTKDSPAKMPAMKKVPPPKKTSPTGYDGTTTPNLAWPQSKPEGDNTILFSNGKQRLRVLLSGNLILGYQIYGKDLPKGKASDQMLEKTVIFDRSSCQVRSVFQRSRNLNASYEVKVTAAACRAIESRKDLAALEHSDFDAFEKAMAREGGSFPFEGSYSKGVALCQEYRTKGTWLAVKDDPTHSPNTKTVDSLKTKGSTWPADKVGGGN